MRITSMFAALASVAMLGAGSAEAATIYVANSCSGAPTPCTTSLSSALGNSSYSTVQLVANSTFTGDFRITRGLTLIGNTGAALHKASNRTYTLRVESTSGVIISDLTMTGRLAVYSSGTVTIQDVDVSGADVGIQIYSSRTVSLTRTTVDASARAVDVSNSQSITVTDGSYNGDSYGLVLSDGQATLDDVDVYGYSRAVVMQDAASTYNPDLDATSSSLTTGNGNRVTWRWDRATTTYTSCSPTPTETVTTSSSLVSLISYDPWTGE